MIQEHEIVLYQVEGTNICVNVVFKDETFWMTQKAMAELFDVNVPAISKHLSNIFEEGELFKEATVSKMEIVQMEGNRKVKREPEFYNLDAIIAVGYRVNSKKATRFRQWATKTLKEYITKGQQRIAFEKITGNIFEFLKRLFQWLSQRQKAVPQDRAFMSMTRMELLQRRMRNLRGRC